MRAGARRQARGQGGALSQLAPAASGPTILSAALHLPAPLASPTPPALTSWVVSRSLGCSYSLQGTIQPTVGGGARAPSGARRSGLRGPPPPGQQLQVGEGPNRKAPQGSANPWMRNVTAPPPLHVTPARASPCRPLGWSGRPVLPATLHWPPRRMLTAACWGGPGTGMAGADRRSADGREREGFGRGRVGNW